MIPRSWTQPVALVGGIRRRVAECASCEQVSPLIRRGLCDRCRDRHHQAGTIGEYGYVKADRLADYAWLTRDCGETVTVAAARIGVTVRTAWRYEAQLREKAPVPPPDCPEKKAA